jgi:hypothetical protein
VASSTWPDGSPRTVDDNEYEILGSAWSTDGIVGSPADTVVVYADSSGMQVKIRSGKYAVVHGKGWYSGSSDITKAISSNGSGQPRIDLVVLGLDRSTQLVTEYVKTGTPSSAPQPPALQRDAVGGGTGKWEIPVARVAVPAGAATISAGNVTTVAPWIGTGPLILPDVASLDRVWTPTPGTTAIVGGDMYLYTAANGWRSANWNTAWGLIGGFEYAQSGAALAAGVGSGETLLNLSTGPVTVTTGRRYQIVAHFRHQHTASGTAVFFLKENSTGGTQRGCYVESGIVGAVGYERHVFGEWSETAGSARTFLLTGYVAGGLMTTYRTGASGEPAFFVVHDMGPGNNITGPI